MSKDKGQIVEFANLIRPRVDSNVLNPARIYEVPQENRCLGPAELARSKQSFRSWAEDSPRADVRASRKRILLIFLLIRYTGARLNEVLTLDLSKHLDVTKGVVRYRDIETVENDSSERYRFHRN